LFKTSNVFDQPGRLVVEAKNLRLIGSSSQTDSDDARAIGSAFVVAEIHSYIYGYCCMLFDGYSPTQEWILGKRPQKPVVGSWILAKNG